MRNVPIRTNSARAWWLASRPKTLTAALVPIITASALAWKDNQFSTRITVLCLIFALLMQIAANFINDLYDFTRGTDRASRLGPKRACTQGWITPRAMQNGILLTLAIAGVAGCIIVGLGGHTWGLVLIGMICVVFAFLYSTLLSYCGMGDVLVWTFFGFIPVLGTYYAQARFLTPEAWIVAAGCGLAIDCLLIVNNYRDRETDRQSDKRTLIVALGARFGERFYLAQGALAYLCCAVLGLISNELRWCLVLPLAYLAWHVSTWRRMVRINHGRRLNLILAQTSRNILLFGVMLALSILLG